MKFALACLILLVATTSFHPKNKKQRLIDKDLSKWEMYLSFKIKNGYKGEAPVDSTGKPLVPVGYNKNVNNMFSVYFENNEPVIKVTGEYYGCLFTKESFENYHLVVQTRFGNKKWEPRLNELRDAGLLYHGRGECGVDYWRSWMLSQEFQVQDTCNGDYWSIANSRIAVKAKKMESGGYKASLTDGEFVTMGRGTDVQGFCSGYANYEKPDGEWNTIELYTFGDKSVHIVNGHVVMVLQHSAYWDGQKAVPMTSGKLSLQSEACEVYYKGIEIENIDKLPAKYEAYFK